MVVTTRICFDEIRRKTFKGLVDRMRLHIKSGSGGTGLPRYGGIGGTGGSVYIEAADKTDFRETLLKFPDKRVAAGHGGNSKSYQILGHPGEDVVVPVPVGVSVYNGQGHLIGDLVKPGDRVLALRGGRGGDPTTQFHGQKGQVDNITLHFKLIADVGFVGFPNAGKSTLLRALSRATPKVANYPFTTIRPNLGVMEYGDHRQITLADLPGLIEGAHRNFGLGHNFLKHVERTSMLLLLVDINGFRLSDKMTHRSAFETVMSLTRELELYKESLLEKPAILAVNKMDTDGAKEKFEELCKRLQRNDVSSVSEDIRPTRVIDFDDVVPIIARDAKNTLLLKQKIRTFLDIHAETEREIGEVKQLTSHSNALV